ncbi:MAG: NADH-quinone oxidoreductase subunit H [bacterium]|nr:NADH-quinone oxidoreductase subunit H [bacterium]
MKLMIAYEIPFILAVFTAVMKAGMTVNLGQIVAAGRAHGAALWSPSGLLAFLAALLCVQAKLGCVPFDVAEAETEINAGPLIEYSGPLLAIFRLTRMMLLAAAPAFLLVLFLGGIRFHGWGIALSVLQYVLLVLLVTVIRNTNPRLRIDQALRFFWGPVTALAAAGFLLAALGY